MRPPRIGALLTAVSCLLSAGVSPAEEAERISNWTAAPYWSGPQAGPPDAPEGRDANPAHTASGRQALAAGPVALPFIALPPCRLVDTRGNGAPLQGGFLPPATPRSYTLTGVCGVPANAQAISLNATAVKPTGPGFLVLYPQGGAFPPVSTLNYLGNDVIVNAAVVPLSGTGGITMALGVSGGDVLLDTNGYYAVADVASLDGLVGDVILAAGSNVTITPAGNTLTIASSAGSGPPSGPAGGVLSGTYPNPGIASGQVVTSLNGLKDSLTVAGTNGISASAAGSTVTVTSNATASNAASTIMARDAGGSFNATSAALTGNINMPSTNAAQTAGVVKINGSTFLHAFGSANTFLGSPTGNSSMTGAGFNTAVGAFAFTSNTTGQNLAAFGTNALDSNTTGSFNAAFGSLALHSNSTGSDNSAFGVEALESNTVSGNTAFGRAALKANTTGTTGTAFGHNALVANTTGNANSAFGKNSLQANVSGSFNTAVGGAALFSSTGNSNTAVGASALNLLTSGAFNIAIGTFAGTSLGSGSSNIYIGADSGGNESNVIRIGSSQTATVIAGIYSQTIGGSGLAVSVDSTGKLGTTSSSRRYKEDIVDIGDESSVLMQLRPVAYYYKPEYDTSRIRQYGLIAEEVDELAPGLVAHGIDGRIETVRYPLVNAMLLNEVQKSRRMIDELRADRDELQKRLDAMEQRLSRLIEKRSN